MKENLAGSFLLSGSTFSWLSTVPTSTLSVVMITCCKVSVVISLRRFSPYLVEEEFSRGEGFLNRSLRSLCCRFQPVGVSVIIMVRMIIVIIMMMVRMIMIMVIMMRVIDCQERKITFSQSKGSDSRTYQILVSKAYLVDLAYSPLISNTTIVIFKRFGLFLGNPPLSFSSSSQRCQKS